MNNTESTVLATLFVTHLGVPIGRTSLIQLSPGEYPEGEPAPIWISGFEPLPDYAVIRSIVVRATEARAKLWFLGPVADPESDRRGREARHAYELLLSQLEVCDDQGRFLPLDHIQLWEGYRNGEPDFSLMGIIDETMATVAARLRAPPRGLSDHEPPAA